MQASASGFSIFAITGVVCPADVINLCRSSTSLARRTNDSASHSMPIPRAKRASSRSLSVSAGDDTDTPGRFMPLWSFRTPPLMTVQAISVPATDSTRSSSSTDDVLSGGDDGSARGRNP